jgi:hypothetical protein
MKHAKQTDSASKVQVRAVWENKVTKIDRK